MTKSASEDEEVEEAEPEDEGLSLERLAQILRLKKELEEMAMSWDPYMDRCLKVTNKMDDALEPYKQLFATLKRQQQQLPITMFLQPAKKTPEKPPEDPEREEDDPEEI